MRDEKQGSSCPTSTPLSSRPRTGALPAIRGRIAFFSASRLGRCAYPRSEDSRNQSPRVRAVLSIPSPESCPQRRRLHSDTVKDRQSTTPRQPETESRKERTGVREMPDVAVRSGADEPMIGRDGAGEKASEIGNGVPAQRHAGRDQPIAAASSTGETAKRLKGTQTATWTASPIPPGITTQRGHRNPLYARTDPGRDYLTEPPMSSIAPTHRSQLRPERQMERTCRAFPCRSSCECRAPR